MKRVLAIVAIACFAHVAQAQNSTSTANQSATSGSQSSTANSGNSSLNNVGNTGTSSATASTQSQSGSSGNSTTITFEGTNVPTSTTSSINQSVSGGTTNVNRNINEGEATQRIIHDGESTQRIEYSGTQTIKNVPSVNGPPLTTSNDTCMGSTSGSINGPGFGVGLGSTWTDKNCVMLKNARELWNMGMKAASLALICNDENNRNALEITGFICPQTAARQAALAEQARQAALEPRTYVPPSYAGMDATTPLPPPVVSAEVVVTPISEQRVVATSEQPTVVRVVSPTQ